MSFFAPDKHRVGFDTETWLIRPGLLAPRDVCATFAGQGAPPRPPGLTPDSVVVAGADGGRGRSWTGERASSSA